MSSAAYYFLPWVRSGHAGGHLDARQPGCGAPGPGEHPGDLRLASSGPGADPGHGRYQHAAADLWPGRRDRDRSARGRAHRAHATCTPDFPPHLLAAIEFDRPDFPWLFTPAAPDGDRLRPWIVLVCRHEATAGVSQVPNRPLPMLECPIGELPDLTDSWLWAHAQFVGAKTADAEWPAPSPPAPTRTSRA